MITNPTAATWERNQEHSNTNGRTGHNPQQSAFWSDELDELKHQVEQAQSNASYWRKEAARLQAERDEARQLLETRASRAEHAIGQVEHILCAPWKNASTPKTVGIAYVLEAYKAPEKSGSDYVELPQSLTLEAMAERLTMSTNTVCQAAIRLESAKVIERTIEKERYGDKPSDWATHSVTAVRLTLPDFADDLPKTEGLKKASTRALEIRTLAKQVKQAACPECGAMGELQITCTACGAVIEPDDLDRKLCDPGEEDSAVQSKSCDSDQVDALDRKVCDVMSSEPQTLRSDTQETVRTVTPPQLQEAIQFPAYSKADMITWLQKRIGVDKRLIEQTGKPDYASKYVEIGTDEPDYNAYLHGRMVYGSRMRLENGLTWGLCYDLDDTGQAIPEQAGRELADAGARPIIWQRDTGAHLELYFDQPVQADQAHAWALSVAPSLKHSRECYPSVGGLSFGVEKQHGEHWKKSDVRAVSWPLTRKVGDQVLSCPMIAFAPGASIFSDGWLAGNPHRNAIRRALALCITPSELIPNSAFPAKLIPDSETRQEQPAPADQTHASRGGVIAFTAQESHEGLSSELKTKIHAWCMGFQESVKDELERNVKHQGNMYSIRADDWIPSAQFYKHADGRYMWHDYGTQHSWDALDVYMIRQGMSKQDALRMVGRWHRQLAA